MNLKKNLLLGFAAATIVGTLFLSGCGNNAEKQAQAPQENAEEEEETSTEAPAAEAPAAETDPMKDKGIGPVTSVEIGSIDKSLAAKGQKVFETKCAACHKFETKYVGPGLKGITKRRTPEWIMNMILNPVEMTQKDPIAKALLEEHLTQMTFQDVSQDDARAILEYFREVDSK